MTPSEIAAFLKVWNSLQGWQYGGARVERIKAVDSEGVTFESVSDGFDGPQVETSVIPWTDIIARAPKEA